MDGRTDGRRARWEVRWWSVVAYVVSAGVRLGAPVQQLCPAAAYVSVIARENSEESSADGAESESG
jgi:hypothetical protein